MSEREASAVDEAPIVVSGGAYLDNAATSLRRPACVVEAVAHAMTSLGNAGRGATAGSLDATRVIEGCRERLARLLGCRRPDHVCFASNATAALNAALSGLVREGDRVVTTVLEHNSVLRPLNRLARERDVELVHVGCDALGRLDYVQLAEALAPGARLVACTHASNVTGNVVDVARVARLAHEAGALCLVDASQSAGCLPVDMTAMGLDVVCLTGHKALMGPQGTGGLAVREGVDIAPWNVGGTGVHSFDPDQSLDWPTRLEAGTPNAHGIAGLSAALDYLEGQGGVAAVEAHERTLLDRLVVGLRAIDGVRLYGDYDQPHRAAICALNVRGLDSSEVADALMQGWGISCRPGAHCAPLMHRALGTERQGIVRLSLGWFTTQVEVDLAVSALGEIAAW